jgi:hypothetical protein
MARDGARGAILRWFSSHPKTFCPVVGQAICPHNGCENPRLRSDARCNIGFKQAMHARAKEARDFRPIIFDLRETPDRQRFIINFGYDKSTILDLKSAIPAGERGYLPASREWWVLRRHYGLLSAMFANFAEFHQEYTRQRRESEASHQA